MCGVAYPFKKGWWSKTPGQSATLATKPSATRLIWKNEFSDLERLFGFLTDTMLGLLSAFFAIVGAAFADGDANWQDVICAGVLAFLISMWIANFVFPNTVRWCLASRVGSVQN